MVIISTESHMGQGIEAEILKRLQRRMDLLQEQTGVLLKPRVEKPEVGSHQSQLLRTPVETR